MSNDLKLQLKLLFVALFFFSNSVVAEPWIDTRDAWLRADIEYLSDHGVIKVPITTWPLMWAPVFKDIKNFDIRSASPELKKVVRRVKYKARRAMRRDQFKFLSIKAGNQGKLLRSFGDDRREKYEISSKIHGMSKSFAWNLETTKAFDPIDGEEQRLDNSYFAGIWGNWIFSIGAQERWWGPGWDSSLILSNNARPVPGISLQRNMSDAFETPWLSWIGPWTFTAFAGQLESDRHVPHAKLLGMSLNFRPLESLEIGLRRTAQWGGEGRPQSLPSLWNLLVGNSNCDEVGLGCNDRSQEPGNQVAGVDLKWRLPYQLGSLYGQLIGEDEAGYLPSRKFYQFGYTNSFELFDTPVKTFLEYSDTENDIGANVTYEHSLYQTGYRTHGRSIGSSYDGDTQSVSLGFVAQHKHYGRYQLILSSVNLNSDGAGKHSVNPDGVKFNQVSLKYQKVMKHGLLGVELAVKDKKIDSYGYQNDKFNVAVSWTMEL